VHAVVFGCDVGDSSGRELELVMLAWLVVQARDVLVVMEGYSVCSTNVDVYRIDWKILTSTKVVTG